MKWFDEHKHLQPQGENGVLFTAEYCMLKSNVQGVNSKLKKLMTDAVESIRDGNSFKAKGDDNFSHDNMTGIVCASKRLGLDYHKKITWKGWTRRIHPRDIIFYLYCKGGISAFFAWFFLWIPAISMILSCKEDYKERNGSKMLKTDGKLLAWMRFNAVKMPITEHLCTYFITIDPKFKSWKNVFKMYFKMEGHPNTIMEDKAYGG